MALARQDSSLPVEEASALERRLAVSTTERAARQVSDVNKRAANATHSTILSDCQRVAESQFQRRGVLQVRLLIAKRVLSDVQAEITSDNSLQVVKHSKTEG